MRVLIAHSGRLFRFVNIDSTTRDGSLNVTIRRDGKSTFNLLWGTSPGTEQPVRRDFDPARAKSKEITVHQSERINFHEIKRSIFVEPLTEVTATTCIYRYRIPAITRLTEFSQQPDPEDAEFNLNDLNDESVSFSIYLGPAGMVPPGQAIKLAYLGKYALAISVDDVLLAVPSGHEIYFTTMKPERRIFDSQSIDEDAALIAYHQALHQTRGQVLYSPNKEGIWQLVFTVPMRDAPKVAIDLVDPDLYVDEKDLIRDPRVNNAMVRFKVRSRTTGEVIKQPVAIRSIELNARLS